MAIASIPKDLELEGIVDMTLTPENAQQRGYQYIDDILYGELTLTDSINDILQLVKTNGYKLGKPSSRNNYAFFYGLYAPQK